MQDNERLIELEQEVLRLKVDNGYLKADVGFLMREVFGREGVFESPLCKDYLDPTDDWE